MPNRFLPPAFAATSLARVFAQETTDAIKAVELGAGYFPDEQEHLAAYLNPRYYRFQ